MLIKATISQLIAFNNAKQDKPLKLSFVRAFSLNQSVAEPHIKSYNDAVKAGQEEVNELMKGYNEERTQIAKDYFKTNEEGKEVCSDVNAWSGVLKGLESKYEVQFKRFKEIDSEISELAKNEVEVEFTMVPSEDLPDPISQDYYNAVKLMVQE